MNNWPIYIISQSELCRSCQALQVEVSNQCYSDADSVLGVHQLVIRLLVIKRRIRQVPINHSDDCTYYLPCLYVHYSLNNHIPRIRLFCIILFFHSLGENVVTYYLTSAEMLYLTCQSAFLSYPLFLLNGLRIRILKETAD